MLTLSHGYILDDTSPQAVLVLFAGRPMPCEHGEAYGHYSIANAYQCASIHRERLRQDKNEEPLFDLCRMCVTELKDKTGMFCAQCKASYCLSCFGEIRYHTLLCQAHFLILQQQRY